MLLRHHTLRPSHTHTLKRVLRCVAVCCSALQCVETCVHHTLTSQLACYCDITHCNTLQHTATHCNTLQHTATCNSHDIATSHTHVTHSHVGTCVAVCCSVLQCVAVCCSVLQCVATCVHHTLTSRLTCYCNITHSRHHTLTQ